MILFFSCNRFRNSGEINGEIEYKCRNLKNNFPDADHIWLFDLKQVEKLPAKEAIDYLSREINDLFSNSEKFKHINKSLWSY